MRLMPDATNAADVILRDGSTLRLRPPEMKDADALLEFFRGLSERSLYLRFHGFPSLRPELVEPLLEPDWVERGALVGTLTRDGTERVVAVGNYVRLRDPVLAEAAFAVDDEHQGRGVGTRLLEQLAERAAEVGIQRFVAEVMADNRTMLGVFEAAGFELTRELAGGELVPAPPGIDAELVRDHLPGPGVGLERFGLAARAGQGAHEQAPQAFPQRVVGEQAAQFGRGLGVPPAAEAGL